MPNKSDQAVIIDRETHRKLKSQAASKGLTIKQYVKELVDKSLESKSN